MRREEITIEELLKRYEGGERNFAGIYLCYTDNVFNSVNLSEIYLRGASFRDFGFYSLPGVVLSRADLSDVFLYRQMLEGASFSRANLSNVCLSQSNLRNSNLSWCNLSGSDLYNACFWGANLSGANLTGANMESVWLDGVKLSNVNLTGAVNVFLEGVIYDNTTMPDGSVRSD